MKTFDKNVFDLSFYSTVYELYMQEKILDLFQLYNRNTTHFWNLYKELDNVQYIHQ